MKDSLAGAWGVPKPYYSSHPLSPPRGKETLCYNGANMPGRTCPRMADALHTLLKYIVDQPLMHEESQEAQRDASAVQDIDAEISKIGADERADAGRLAPAFAQGLRAA